MKTQINFKSYLTKLRGLILTLIALLTLGIGNAWGADSSETSTFTDKYGNVGDGEPEWTCPTGENGFDNTYGIMYSTTKNSGRTVSLTSDAFDGKKIKSVSVVVRRNKNYAITLSVKVGSTTLGSGDSGAKNTQATLTTSSDSGIDAGTITITLSTGAPSSSPGSLYVKSITVTYEDDTPAFTVTATSSNNAHGTVEVSGTTITATPADCYQVVSGTGGYTITSGTATVSHTGTSNTLTVTPSSNCAVQVNFEKKTVNTYIDEIQDNGEIEDCSTEAPSLSDKAAVTSGTCAQQHYHFVGWVTAANKANPTDANIIEAGETVDVNGTTYYAVWAKGSGGGSFDGTAGGTFKIYADVNGTKYYATGTGSKINSTTNATDASEYIFTKISDGVYSIKLGTDYIKYNSSTNLGTQSTSYSWTITAATHGSWRVTSETSGRAWIYRAGTTNQFGGYSTGNVNGTEYYDLEIGGSTSYSDYITTCCTSLGTINGPINFTTRNSHLLESNYVFYKQLCQRSFSLLV